jgi:hypothetical protein
MHIMRAKKCTARIAIAIHSDYRSVCHCKGRAGYCLDAISQGGLDPMSRHRSFTELTRNFSPKRKARVARRVAELKAEMALAELRQAHRRSQEERTRALRVNQPVAAKLEKRIDRRRSSIEMHRSGGRRPRA